uniref:Uncharacterized protein n=1 Tax=Astyanax mexicanus TaxID=7994 RepID=A0A8B9KBC3_ASTMX
RSSRSAGCCHSRPLSSRAGWPGRSARGRPRPARAGSARRSRAARGPAPRTSRSRCARSPCPWRWGAGTGEHGRGKGRRVIVDVQDDDFSFKQVHPALRGADHGHLEVNKTLVLVENHLTLLQLLAVDPSLVGAQVPGDVVNLEVVGAGLERKRHLAGPGYDAQVGGYIPHAYVRGTLLGQAVAQHLLCHRGLTQQLQQEPAVAYTVHCGRSPHRSGMIFHSKKIKGKNISNKKKSNE